MTTSKQQPAVEWVGGLVSMPAYVTGDGEPYRPEALLWLDAEGAVIGMMVDKPGVALAAASDSLREAMQRPLWGPAHSPSRVRVAAPTLAVALREGHPGLDIVCAPTPEVDAVLASMNSHLSDSGGAKESYLAPDITPAAIGACFRAAADLFRAKPWSVVPGDQCMSVTIEQLGVHDAVLVIIGQMGESFGFLLYSSIDDFKAFLDAAPAIERGERPTMPPHFALNFERGAELSDTLRKEIATHGWEVAAADAYPWLVAVDPDLVGRGPTGQEVRITEALALALPRILEAGNELQDAWDEGVPFTQSVTAQTNAGDVVVTMTTPCAPALAPAEVMTKLRELGQSGEPLDPDVTRPLEDALIQRFAASEEARPLSDVGVCHLVMDLAGNYFGTTIATLSGNQLREIIFEIFPRKVSIEASAAPVIIAQLRAFYTFLKREFGLVQADACLRLLGRNAATQLEHALSNAGGFGMAKSLLMGGQAAGFDPTSQEGIEAMLRAFQSQPLPGAERRPTAGTGARRGKSATAAKQRGKPAGKKKR